MDLRKIKALEVNKKIIDLPNNIFAYSYGHSFSRICRSEGNDYLQLKVEKRNPGDHEKNYFFEVRKYTPLDVRLVGYITDESQLTYTRKGLTENEIVVFPKESQEYKNLIEIQLINEPIKILNRNIELDDDEVITILEISKLPVEQKLDENNSIRDSIHISTESYKDEAKVTEFKESEPQESNPNRKAPEWLLTIVIALLTLSSSPWWVPYVSDIWTRITVNYTDPSRWLDQSVFEIVGTLNEFSTDLDKEEFIKKYSNMLTEQEYGNIVNTETGKSNLLVTLNSYTWYDGAERTIKCEFSRKWRQKLSTLEDDMVSFVGSIKRYDPEDEIILLSNCVLLR